MTNRLLRISLAAALMAILAACGNKGPLMHPAAPVDDIAVPATTAPATPASLALPTPASTMPATPADATTPPAASGGG